MGTALTDPLAGKRVAINPLMSCNDCDFCGSGNHHLCASRELIGMRYPEAFAKQVMVPDAKLTVLADNLSFSEAALAEPTAVAVRVVEIAVRAGRRRTFSSSFLVVGRSAFWWLKRWRRGALPRRRLGEGAPGRGDRPCRASGQ